MHITKIEIPTHPEIETLYGHIELEHEYLVLGRFFEEEIQRQRDQIKVLEKKIADIKKILN